MRDEHGEWTVETNDDDTGVILIFTHMGDEGVETFVTGLAPENAIPFAEAVLEHARAIL